MDLCTEDEVGHLHDDSNTWTYVQRMMWAMFRMAHQYMDLCTEDEVGHVQDGSPIHRPMYRG